jgi:hypothetical protein
MHKPVNPGSHLSAKINESAGRIAQLHTERGSAEDKVDELTDADAHEQDIRVAENRANQIKQELHNEKNIYNEHMTNRRAYYASQQARGTPPGEPPIKTHAEQRAGHQAESARFQTGYRQQQQQQQANTSFSSSDLSPEARAAGAEAAGRQKELEEEASFRSDFADRTAREAVGGAEGGGLVSGVGNLTGRIARTAYVATSLARSTGGLVGEVGGGSWDFIQMGRHLTQMRHDVSALKQELGGLAREGKVVGGAAWAQMQEARRALNTLRGQVKDERERREAEEEQRN